MFPGIANARIFLYRLPIDMRKSYDTLAALAENELGEEPTSGALFVFLNRPRNWIKIIYYEKGGFCIWMKRLEAGSFPLPPGDGKKQLIDTETLVMILDGLKVIIFPLLSQLYYTVVTNFKKTIMANIGK